MGYRAVAAPLLPLIWFQGRRLRRVMPRLAEPSGARMGGGWDASDADAGAPPLRLLVLGDSAAAGVGAGSQDDALLGQLVGALTPSRPVAWCLVARTGATAAGTRRHLADRPAGRCDVAVVSLGLNDVVAGRDTSAVLDDLGALVDTLHGQWGARHVILSGIPPIGRFPSLPQPLRWYLGARARRLDVALAAWAGTREGCEVVRMDFGFDVTKMATDGFHPGPAMYTAWAHALAARVLAWSAARDD